MMCDDITRSARNRLSHSHCSWRAYRACLRRWLLPSAFHKTGVPRRARYFAPGLHHSTRALSTEAAGGFLTPRVDFRASSSQRLDLSASHKWRLQPRTVSSLRSIAWLLGSCCRSVRGAANNCSSIWAGRFCLGAASRTLMLCSSDCRVHNNVVCGAHSMASTASTQTLPADDIRPAHTCPFAASLNTIRTFPDGDPVEIAITTLNGRHESRKCQQTGFPRS